MSDTGQLRPAGRAPSSRPSSPPRTPVRDPPAESGSRAPGPGDTAAETPEGGRAPERPWLGIALAFATGGVLGGRAAAVWTWQPAGPPVASPLWSSSAELGSAPPAPSPAELDLGFAELALALALALGAAFAARAALGALGRASGVARGWLLVCAALAGARAFVPPALHAARRAEHAAATELADRAGPEGSAGPGAPGARADRGLGRPGLDLDMALCEERLGRARVLTANAERALACLAAERQGAPLVEIPCGALGAGELAALYAGLDRRAFARGPGDGGWLDRLDGPWRRLAPLFAPRASALRLEADLDEIVRLAPARAGPFERARSALLARLRAALAGGLEAFEPGRSRALALALLFGDASALSLEDKELFVRTGTLHLLAVSGMHVSLVAACLMRPAALCARSLATSLGRSGAALGWLASPLCGRLIGCAVLALYALLVGARAPVVRATIAVAFAWLTPWADRRQGRPPDGLSFWSFALACECLLDPGAAERTDVLLSYAATLGILRLQRPLTRAVRAGGARLGALAGLAPALDWERAPSAALALRARAARAAAAALAASLAASLATLPIAWSRFGEFSLAGPLATPCAVPLVAFGLAFGWCALFGAAPAAPFDLGARALYALLELLDRWPGTPLPLAPRPALLVAAAALCSALAAAGRRGARGPAALAWGALLVPWAPSPRDLEVAAIDAGHGTAVLVRAPGEPAWIFDAGSRDRLGVGRAVARALARWEVRRPVYCVSHLDRDHTSALEWLAERFPPRAWVGALSARQAERLPHGLEHSDVGVGRARLAGRGPVGFALARGLPSARGPVPENEKSRSLSLETASGWVHLMGDAEAEALASVLREGHLGAPARLLLLPHHGSDGPHAARLLDALRPERIWISASDPSPLEPELRRRGLPVEVTGRDGPLVWRAAAAAAH